MADISLKIDSGEKEIELVNEKRGTSVNVVLAVYDIFFLGKIMELAEKMDAMQNELQKTAPAGTADAKQFIEFYHKSQDADKEMRVLLDGLFGAPVCDTLFPEQSMFTIGNGAPTWANILYAIIDQMDDGLAVEKNNAKARITKYSAKYKR